MEYEYVAVPLVGGGALWRKEHFTYWQEYLLSDGWKEFVRAPWKPIAPGDTGGACVFRREVSSDEPRKWTKAEIRALFQEEMFHNDELCTQCGKWLDPVMSCCPHCLASTLPASD